MNFSGSVYELYQMSSVRDFGRVRNKDCRKKTRKKNKKVSHGYFDIFEQLGLGPFSDCCGLDLKSIQDFQRAPCKIANSGSHLYFPPMFRE